jgi:poly(3-hydroxybutyrate) depolymerase
VSETAQPEVILEYMVEKFGHTWIQMKGQKEREAQLRVHLSLVDKVRLLRWAKNRREQRALLPAVGR